MESEGNSIEDYEFYIATRKYGLITSLMKLALRQGNHLRFIHVNEILKGEYKLCFMAKNRIKLKVRLDNT